MCLHAYLTSEATNKTNTMSAVRDYTNSLRRLRLGEKFFYTSVDEHTAELTSVPFILDECLEKEQQLVGTMFPNGADKPSIVVRLGWCDDGKWRVIKKAHESVTPEIKNKYEELELPRAAVIPRPGIRFSGRPVMRTDPATTRRQAVRVSVTGQRIVQYQQAHAVSAAIQKVSVAPPAHMLWKPPSLPGQDTAAVAGKLSSVKI